MGEISGRFFESGVFDMTLVPLYWYVEPMDGSECFEADPRCIARPCPFSGAVALHDADGEVCGEAVLMCRLPWPRFRCFADGKQVVLPFGTAVSLEKLEAAHRAVDFKGMFVCGCDEPLDRGSHYRVEIGDVSVHCGLYCGRHYKLL